MLPLNNMYTLLYSLLYTFVDALSEFTRSVLVLRLS